MSSQRDVDQAVDEIVGEPGPADIEQQHADPMNHPAVRVAQDGPVMVQTLPADGPSGTGRVSLFDNDLERTRQVLKLDGRRVRWMLVSSVAFRFGFSQQGAISGAIWPANQPLWMTSTNEVWVSRDVGDVVVSWAFESWTR